MANITEFKLNPLDGSTTTEYSDGVVKSGSIVAAAEMTDADVARVRAASIALDLTAFSQVSGLDAIRQAAARRVDLVMLGDSNQAFNGYGFTQGIEKRLQALYGAYATPIITAGGGGSGGGFGYLAASRPNNEMTLEGDADVHLGGLFTRGIGKCSIAHGYLAAAGSAGQTGGVILAAGHSIGAELALNVYLAWAGSPGYSGGTFRPRLRTSAAGEVAYGASTSTALSMKAMRMTTLVAAANPARAGLGLEAGWSAPNGVAATGPITTFYSRLEAASRDTGISCHTLYGVGGDSAWDMAYSVVKAPTESLSTYFSEVRRLQIAKGQVPMVVVYINTGLNDRNETDTPSLGGARSTAPDSAAAYVDNVSAIMARIREVWRVNGWAQSELSWIIVPSHRISDPDDAKLIGYRAAAKAAFGARPDCSVVDLGESMTFAQADAGGWYGAGQNQLHLTNAGYDAVSALIFPAV